MARFNSMLAKALLVLVSCAALAQSANAVLVYNFNQYDLFPSLCYPQCMNVSLKRSWYGA